MKIQQVEFIIKVPQEKKIIFPRLNLENSIEKLLLRSRKKENLSVHDADVPHNYPNSRWMKNVWEFAEIDFFKKTFSLLLTPKIEFVR